MLRRTAALFCCLLVLLAGCAAGGEKKPGGLVLASYPGGQVLYEDYAPLMDPVRASAESDLRDQMAVGIYTARYLEELGEPVDQEQFLISARQNLLQTYLNDPTIEQVQQALGLSDQQLSDVIIESQYLFYTSQLLMDLFTRQHADDSEGFAQAMEDFYARSDEELITTGLSGEVLATLKGEEIPLSETQKNLLRYEDLRLIGDLSYQLLQIQSQNQDMKNYGLSDEGLEEFIAEDEAQLKGQQVFLDALAKTRHTLEDYLAANRALCAFSFYQESYRAALTEAYNALPEGEDKPASAEAYISQHLLGLIEGYELAGPAELAALVEQN